MILRRKKILFFKNGVTRVIEDFCIFFSFYIVYAAQTLVVFSGICFTLFY